MSSNTPVTPPAEDSGSERSILTDLRAGPGEAPVMPDLGGINPTTPKSKYKVHSQTLVIALVLAASGAALYTMRKQGMGSGMVFKNLKVEYDVDKKGRPINDAQEQRILSDLARSQDPAQLPQGKIQKNPFQLDTQTPAIAGAPIDEKALGAAMKLQQERDRLEAIRTAVAGIEVGSIMEGSNPLARINGKLYHEGDIVSEVLKINAIHDRSVEFEADGKLFVVNMSENTPGKGRGPLPRK